jgi:CheY-like chemotaxis protein
LCDDLEDARALIQRALGESIALCYDLAPDLWPVWVDRGQLQQVVLNLALNARDAMGDGGSFTLRARNQPLDASRSELRHERPGEYVTLAVSDTGSGMDEATRARVFEPFFTTKPAGRGTGLGLAMVFGALKQLGGFVEVHSQLHVGSTFTLWFPRAAGEPIRSRRPSAAPARTAARVLLVEDNPAVANVARRVLQAAGHSVRVSGDPHEALRMWREEPADVLVTDVEMPGMSGLQLRQRLCADTPDLRTLFVTGHSTARLDVDAHDGRTAIVLKPFSREELLVELARLLSAP